MKLSVAMISTNESTSFVRSRRFKVSIFAVSFMYESAYRSKALNQRQMPETNSIVREQLPQWPARTL